MICSLLSLAAALAIQGQKPAAPLVPLGCTTEEQALLGQAARAISRGDFASATTLLRPDVPSPVVRVAADWAPVPKELRPRYAEALKTALATWNAARVGSLQFALAERSDDADVRLFFERKFPVRDSPGCVEVVFDKNARTASVYLATLHPADAALHGPDEMEALFERSLGVFLGLRPDDRAEAVLRAKTHADADQALRPTAEEIDILGRLQVARSKLLEFATKGVLIVVPKPKVAFDPASVDAGTVMVGDAYPFSFNIRNTGDAPLEIDAKPGCGCTIVQFEKAIAPGGVGTVKGELHTAGFDGRISKSITVSTNDSDLPAFSLVVLATVQPIIQFSPPGQKIVPLNGDADTPYDLKVKLSDREHAEITGASTTASFASATLIKGQGSEYTVRVVFSKEAPIGRTPVAVTLTTNSKRQPSANSQFLCEKGILVSPPTAFFGSIGGAAKLPITQQITVAKHGGTFHITKIDNIDDRLKIESAALPGSQGYRLTLTYSGGWQAGRVMRVVTLHTDDPGQPTITFGVVAMVAG